MCFPSTVRKPRRPPGSRVFRIGLGALLLSEILWGFSKAQAQSFPQIEVGWILETEWMKTGSDLAPLQVNQGRGSFLNNWAVLAEARIDSRLSVFSEVQTIRGLNFGLYALSAVYRITETGILQVEVGKFLAPFGTFLVRRWASENPLIDYPLLYNYRTAISASQLPHTRASLLSVRGNGHDLHYPASGVLAKRFGTLGTQSAHLPRPNWGLKVISRDVYLTGIQVFGSSDRLFYAVAVTNGALSNPVDINNSNGVQIIARLRITPITGLDLGSSFSSAPYLDEGAVGSELAAAGVDAGQFRQWVWGADVSYSRGHAILFAELAFNRWETPFLSADLDLLGGYIEAKYTLTPRFFVAGRWSRMVFSEISDPMDVDTDGRFSEPWDYDVRQIELGVGYRLARNALLKATHEFNRTLDSPDGDPSDDAVRFQAVVFF